MKKYYSFSSKEYLSDPKELEIVGVRGQRVMDLASLGAPILPGFLIPNEVLHEEAEKKSAFKKDLQEAMAKIQEVMGKSYNDPDNPLLVKVVESPILQMVSGFSIHNIGLCDSTVDGFAKYVGEDFAYHEYRNVWRKIVELNQKVESDGRKRRKLDSFKQELDKAKKISAIKNVIDKYRDTYDEAIFNDAYQQLIFVVELFLRFFQENTSNEDSGLLIQAMTFGNYGEKSYFGTFHTRDIVSGDPHISGQFFVNAFDATKTKGNEIQKIDKKFLDRLIKLGENLEEKFKEIRQVRFTVESGKLWVIDQVPVPNKSAQAEIKTLLDLNKKKAVSEEYVVSTIKPGRLSEILHPVLDLNKAKKVSAVDGGIAGAVGAAVGRVFFTTEALLKAYKVASQKGEDTDFILVMPSTFAEDVKAIEVAKGVLTSEGGYASHAPVVARSLGKVALVYPELEFQNKQVKIKRKVIKEGDYIALNVPYYEAPQIYFDKVDLIKPTPDGSGLLEFLEIVQNFIDDFDVHANADQPKDAELARKFYAHGIGLCRTEHMFFDESRIQTFRSMIIAGNQKERQKTLNKLKRMQTNDFYKLFKVMDGLPVTIRLLDAPLHEFFPHSKETMTEFIKFMRNENKKLTENEIRFRCDMLKEFNPMLGHRGIRIAISYPEIYNMQVEAIFEAAYKLKKEGGKVIPEIMIPLVMSENEIKTIRSGKRIEGKSITGIKAIEEDVRKKYKTTELEYRVGTMIELPAAALQADKIARYADFFSFGTNDLTQTTNGLSRDDFNSFFTDYNEFDLLENNPFKILAPQVKEMIKIAAERGKLTRPDITMGLCGEHGAEPENISFVKETGLDYVSCSPFGIPIAKLAIAQLNILERQQEQEEEQEE